MKMLKVNVTADRVNWLWRVEIETKDGIIFSRIAHSLKELSTILKDAGEIVLQEHIKEES